MLIAGLDEAWVVQAIPAVVETLLRAVSRTLGCPAGLTGLLLSLAPGTLLEAGGEKLFFTLVEPAGWQETFVSRPRPGLFSGRPDQRGRVGGRGSGQTGGAVGPVSWPCC